MGLAHAASWFHCYQLARSRALIVGTADNLWRTGSSRQGPGFARSNCC